MIELRAPTSDGVQLSLRAFPAQGEARAVLLCGHAMMANGRYFHKGAAGFAPSMAASGITTYVFDFRAHGQSVPPSPAQSQHCFDSYVRFDLPAVLACAAEHAGVAPEEMCYLGHSLGGVAALAAIGSGAIPPPRRLSLWAVSLWLQGPGGGLKGFKRRSIMRAYKGAAALLGRAPIRRLGLGSDDESAGYVRQLADWALSGRWESREGLDYEALLSSIEVPTLGVLGAGDRLCGPSDAERFLTRLPSALPLRMVGTEMGDPMDPDHFSLFTDPRMAALWAELGEFCAAP